MKHDDGLRDGGRRGRDLHPTQQATGIYPAQ